jgi:lysyl-tRNA synthetase class 2
MSEKNNEKVNNEVTNEKEFEDVIIKGEGSNVTMKRVLDLKKVKIAKESHLIQERVLKLKRLVEEKEISPYPYSFKESDNPKEIKEKYDKKLKPEEHSKKNAKISGRVITKRDMGKAAFLKIRCDEIDFQFYLSIDSMGKKAFKFLKLIDVGDFVGGFGEIFKTKTGEITLNIEKFQLLSKCLRPLPEKYHGVVDTEIKYRQRYLDLIMNRDSREVFRKRSLAMKTIRNFLDNRGYMEVETPILHPLYGGAAAKPFITHHNELDMDLFLRISPELYLKRLIVGGFDKVYDINKNFRNEGIDTTHNPEFTMIELYEAYADYNTMMEITEKMYEAVALKLNGTTKSNFKGHEIDFKTPWKRVTMLDSIKEHSSYDLSNMTIKELKDLAKKHKIEMDKEESWGNYVAAFFEHFCEEKIIQPTFVIDHPRETTPLCKGHREDPRLIERFEPFCCGIEMANAYSELNDPLTQRELLEDQARQLRAGLDEEATPMDEDFAKTIEYGMPPTGGLGIGIDRMLMFILGIDSIRDIILFPTMKPEEIESKKDNKNKDSKESKSKN